MKIRKCFKLTKTDPETGLTTEFEKTCEQRVLSFLRLPSWNNFERLMGRHKKIEEGFPSLDEIEDLLHGRW